MTSVYEKTIGEYLITSNTKKMDVKVIRDFLSERYYWADNVSLSKVERFMKYSLCYAIIFEKKTIGFTRVITDYTAFAYLVDMFILPEYRGKGLLKNLIEFVQTNPELKDVKRWLLGEKDTTQLYEQFGWKGLSTKEAQRFVQKFNLYVYKEDKNA